MRHDYRIANVEPWHIAHVAQHMRQADRDELAALCGRHPAAVLESSVGLSPHAFTGLVDGEPVCLFGVGAGCLVTGHGLIWLLGTDVLAQHKLAFLRRSREVLRVFLTLYPVLSNRVDCRNALSIAWLKWLGFQFLPPAPYGIGGLPFMRFEIRRNDHV